jgi:transcriptional regulator with XRE-family HTH domain
MAAVKPSQDASIAGRIRGAMIAGGIPGAAALARRIGLPRQTVHRWLNGDTKNMTHENLYHLADALNVRARWLALGDVDPSNTLDFKDENTSELMAMYGEMSPSVRDQWLAIGRFLLTIQASGKATRHNPYPAMPVRKARS